MSHDPTLFEKICIGTAALGAILGVFGIACYVNLGI